MCNMLDTRLFVLYLYFMLCRFANCVHSPVRGMAEGGEGSAGVALPSRVWRKSQKYFVHATEMRKIHFGHWQWVPAACVVGAAPPLFILSVSSSSTPPFPSDASTVAIFMLEYYLCTADSVNCGCIYLP